MKVGVYLHNKQGADKEREIYRNILTHNGYDCVPLYLDDLPCLDKLLQLDFLVFKWSHEHNDHQIAKNIIPILENHGKVKIFPNWQTSWFYDDKIKQDIQMKVHGFPFVDSWVFYDREKALQWLTTAKYPLVFKLSWGSGSQNVFLLRDFRHARNMVAQMFGRGRSQDSMDPLQRIKLLNGNMYKFYKYYRNKYFNFLRGKDSTQYWMLHKNYVYFQKFCPDNTFDIRVSTAGLRAHAFKRFVRKGDFRASGGDTWDINPDRMDKRCIKIALEISKHFGFQAMAYDFVYDEGNPVIVEMSYAYGGAGYPDFMNGYWDENLDRHEGRFFPQYFELVDLLQDSNLKCPDIKLDNSYKNRIIVE